MSNKVVLLTPALMLPNNRSANLKAMSYALENYNLDEYIVYDQEFKQDDYLNGITYIGHEATRQGFVKSRNKLLEYFYNSDADYAIWIDANGWFSESCLNDLHTIVDNLKSGKLDLDVMASTLGIQISKERMYAKQRPDYFSKVYVVRCKKGYEWFHGLFIKNYKKYYNKELYMDERCDPYKGISEDIFFPRLLHHIFDYRLCPTLSVTKPSNKTSTWVNDKDGYDYPKVDYITIEDYVKQNITKFNYDLIPKTSYAPVVALDRLHDASINLLREYKHRSRKK